MVQIDAHARTKVAETHLFPLYVLILQPFCAVAVFGHREGVCVGGSKHIYDTRCKLTFNLSKEFAQKRRLCRVCCSACRISSSSLPNLSPRLPANCRIFHFFPPPLLSAPSLSPVSLKCCFSSLQQEDNICTGGGESMWSSQ